MTDVVSVVIGVEVLVDVEVKPDVDKVTLVSPQFLLPSN